MKTQHFDRVTLGSGPAPIGEGRSLYQVDLGTRDRVAVLAGFDKNARLEDPAFDLIQDERFDIVATLDASATGAAIAHSYSMVGGDSTTVMEAGAAIYSLMAQGGWDESQVMVFSMTHVNVNARPGEHRVGAWLVVRPELVGEIEIERHSGWDAVIEELSVEQQRDDLAVLLFNVDSMLAYNDRNGHSEGDLVLTRVHSCIANAVGSGFTQRVGGDEFAVVCRSPEAVTLAESLRANVEAMKIPQEHEAVKTIGAHLTVSVGVLDLASSLPSSLRKDAQGLKSQLQEIVYKAKRDGRNRVAAHQ